jgi:hypothetical protein
MPEEPKAPDKAWDVTFEQVRNRQILDVALLTTPEQRLAHLEEMLDTFKDYLPRKEILDSW